MSSKVDRTAFLREPTRLAIAELCRDEALTLAEIAADLGRSPGSLSQPKTMVDHGALVSGTRRLGADGRGGGRTFRLNPDWEPALDEARRSGAPTWRAGHQDLLLIPLSDAEAAAAILSSGIPPEVEWGARVHGAGSGLLLAPAQSGRGTLRVIRALGDIGSRVAELHLSKIMAPVELQAWCAAEGSIDRRLPPKS